MRNAKEEFIDHVDSVGVEVKAVCIDFRVSGYPKEEYKQLRYVKGEDYQQLLKELDFEYDSGFGGQRLFGVIWYQDGTWSERGEYDGSEWWTHMKMPNVDEWFQADTVAY